LSLLSCLAGKGKWEAAASMGNGLFSTNDGSISAAAGR